MSSVESSMPRGLSSILRSQDAVLAFALIFIIAMMILPLPPLMLDLLIALNFALSIGVLLISMYIATPMDFYVFPTSLLLVTLFRLGINVSASRLIGQRVFHSSTSSSPR